MKEAASDRTWRVTLSTAQTPLLVVGLLALLLVTAEILSRNQFIRSHLPAPGLGSRSRLLEIQLDQLRTSAARRGGVDCIVFGNSLAFFGFDPDAFDAAYYRHTGQHIRSYNFGVLGMTAAGVAPMARILADDYHPWLLVYAVSARDLTWGGEDPTVYSMPWVQYRLGKFSLDGWLTDKSSVYRYYLAYRNWHNNENINRIRHPIAFSPEGFLATKFNLTDRAAKLEMFRSTVTRALGAGVARAQISGLDRFVELRADGRQPVVVEMPVHPSLKNLLETTDIYTRPVKQMRSAARRHRAPFWRKQSWQMIPDDGWADFWHLNARGAAIFSRWLGERVAIAVHENKLTPGVSR